MSNREYYHSEKGDFSYDFNLENDFKYDLLPHTHSNYEIYFFLGGNGSYFVEGKNYSMNKNDVFITNKSELHRPVLHNRVVYNRQFVQFDKDYIFPLNDGEYNFLYALEKRKIGFNNKIDAKLVEKYGIDKLFSKMHNLCNENKREKNVQFRLILAEILIKINNIYEQYLEHNQPKEQQNKVREVIDYINGNLGEKITLDTLEKQFYVNRYHLCHIFKDSTGFSIFEYITNKRIMQAKILIAEETSLTEISSDVGFNDYSSFFRAFKKIVGVSPQDYRKKF